MYSIQSILVQKHPLSAHCAKSYFLSVYSRFIEVNENCNKTLHLKGQPVIKVDFILFLFLPITLSSILVLKIIP